MNLAEKVLLDEMVKKVEALAPLAEQMADILERLDKIEKKLWAGQIKR